MRLRFGGDDGSFNDSFGLLGELGEIAMGGKRATLRLGESGKARESNTEGECAGNRHGLTTSIVLPRCE